MTSTAQPATAAAVASIHRQRAAGRRSAGDSAPVKTGALPIATTVPTATPVIRTAVKKHTWYPADGDGGQDEGRAVSRSPGQQAGGRPGGPPAGADRDAEQQAPPSAILAAPIDAELAPAGAKCAAVPVLPQAAAPSRMATAPPACRGLRGPSSRTASVSRAVTGLRA